MKNFKYIFILLAAVLATACADEGPEIVAKLDVTGSVTNITPISADLQIVVGNGNDNIIRSLYNVDVISEQDEWMYCNHIGTLPGLDATTYLYKTESLKPNTTYKVYIRGCTDPDGDGETIEICLSELTFTTMSIDEVASAAEFKMTTQSVEDNAVRFTIQYPTELSLGDESCLYISQRPHFADDPHYITIPFSERNSRAAQSSEQHASLSITSDYVYDEGQEVVVRRISVFISGLQASTTYYVSLDAIVQLNDKYGYPIDEVSKLIKPADNSFTTKAQGWLADQLGVTVEPLIIANNGAVFKLQLSNNNSSLINDINSYGIEVLHDGNVVSSSFRYTYEGWANTYVPDLDPSTNYTYRVCLMRSSDYVYTPYYYEVKNPDFTTPSAIEPAISYFADPKLTDLKFERVVSTNYSGESVSYTAKFNVELPAGLYVSYASDITLMLYEKSNMESTKLAITGSSYFPSYGSYLNVDGTSMHVCIEKLSPGTEYYFLLSGFYVLSGYYETSQSFKMLLHPDIDTFTTPAN